MFALHGSRHKNAFIPFSFLMLKGANGGSSCFMPIGGNEVVLIVSLLSMDKLTTHTDARGCLTIVEAQKDFPFSVDRVYWLHSVPEGAERGYHASRSCSEYLVVMSGRVEVVLEDATGRNTYQLRQKDEGLLVPPFTWIELKHFSEDAVLLVLASDTYQPESYINDYEEFQQVILRGDS